VTTYLNNIINELTRLTLSTERIITAKSMT